MLTPLQEIERRTAEAIRQATGVDADPAIAPSQNPQFGDYQSNAAMPLAGRLGAERGQKLNPRSLAEQIIAKLDASDLLAVPPTVAGPGFINFSLSPAWVASRATEALREEKLGVPRAEPRQRVVVEYSSPNIAKQMHVGHIRTTILGDALSRVMAYLGHEVIRQNHVGDWGTQFGMLIERLREIGGVENARIGDLELFYREAKKRFDEDEGFKERARDTVVRLQRGDEEERRAWQQLVDETRKHTHGVYQRLGVLLTVEDERGE